MHLLAVCSVLIGITNAWSPTNGYAPGDIDCPSESSFLRVASGISTNESNWITNRHQATKQPLIDWLNRANLTDFDAEQFLSNITSIPIGLAYSGGGYRAMLAGAGQFAALDDRTPNSTNANQLGGLVQAATYLAGLSGGNWLVGSIVLNNFTTIPDLQGSSNIWDLEHSLIDPDGANIFSDASFWDDIVDDIDSKRDAGFNISFTDIWGRGLSHQFINLTNGGPALTFDDIRNYPAFLNYSMPFPIHVADSRAPGTTVISANSTIFEFNPFELGSWDPELYTFTDIKYLGTQVNDGKNNGTCVAGFDNAGFVLGTSSSLFNQFILQLNSTGVEGILKDLAEDILTDLGNDNDDIAIYDPNPFANSSFTMSTVMDTAPYLTLVDGGEDNQNVPLHPLIQPARNVDIVLAFDNSADTDNNWPAGLSLIATYERQFNPAGNNTIFPYVPDNQTFLNLGLTEKPTFFGCHASNFTSLFEQLDVPQDDQHIPPLIVYIANSPHSYLSNTSTFQLSYSQSEVAGMIQNGYETATQNNGTTDPEWPACLACAIIQRESERQNLTQSQQCQQCFSRYCWNGTIAAGNVSEATLNPSTSIKSLGLSLSSSTTAVAVAVFGSLLFF
jgi:lysophospholipase